MGFSHGRRDFGHLSMSPIDFYGDFKFCTVIIHLTRDSLNSCFGDFFDDVLIHLTRDSLNSS